jgi:signal transduction histidine kinase
MRLTLRWRLVLLASTAVAVLGVAAVAASYVAVRSSLLNDLQRNLHNDAAQVARLYGSGEPGTARDTLSGPTGGVTVNLYDTSGRLLASSSSSFAVPRELIPVEVVKSAISGPRDWQGHAEGRHVLVALAPFGVGVAAVVSDTEAISSMLRRLSGLLLIIAVSVVISSVIVGNIVAGNAIRPLRNLARQAAQLGPDRLEPIKYDGPDDELGLLSRTLNELISRLAQTLEAQRQFLLETSHELRTPLTSLQGFLDRGLRRANPEVSRDLAAARRIAGSMSRLVEDLLQLTRGQSVRDLVPHLVDPLVDILRPVANEYPGVTVLGDEGALLIGDPGRLLQLIRNLTANAVRASGGTESVQLELRIAGPHAELVIRDDGPGITAEAQEHIFDKFYKGAGGGAGLGLAIAKQISEQHGGDITLHSVPGRTEFMIRLPLIEAPDEAAEEDGAKVSAV